MNFLGEPVELTPRCIDPQTALEELQARLPECKKSRTRRTLGELSPISLYELPATELALGLSQTPVCCLVPRPALPKNRHP